MNLGAAIRRRRHRAGMSMRCLAALAQMNVGQVSRYERSLAHPLWPAIVQIAQGLGMRPSELVADAEKLEGRL